MKLKLIQKMELQLQEILKELNPDFKNIGA
jgi:hypothetical protein